MAKFGLSRDHRKDRPQVLLALVVSKEGFPFFWRVLRGDMHDSSTVKGTELEFVIMVIAVSCVKLLSAHNSTQHTSRKHKV
jgi:Transposase